VKEDVAREVAVDELRARLDGALRRHQFPYQSVPAHGRRQGQLAPREVVRDGPPVRSTEQDRRQRLSRTLSWNASPTRRMSSHLPG